MFLPFSKNVKSINNTVEHFEDPKGQNCMMMKYDLHGKRKK